MKRYAGPTIFFFSFKTLFKIEDAFIERDKVLSRERQAQEEIQRLNDRIVESAQKIRLKSDTEIAALVYFARVI